MKFYYAGQTYFGNRGCEALIRSNTKIIREAFPRATFLCPSDNPALDRRQWPDAEAQGVRFTSVPKFPFLLKVMSRLVENFPAVKALPIPALSIDSQIRRDLEECDAVLMTGGDNISLDYGLFSLYFWVGLMETAKTMGKPIHIVAGSIGPFTEDKAVEKQMVRHLKGYTSITVRETASLQYLSGLGVENVKLVADPAFVLEAEVWDTSAVFRPGRRHVGLNVSPLVRRLRADEASRAKFDNDIKNFVRTVVRRDDMDIVFIPHVDPLEGPSDNSDRAYMGRLLAELSDVAEHVRMTPDLLNAAQIKHALKHCAYFIGARTHATIGAISQKVPTISIAYSVKALGINKDLFGTLDYVLPTPYVSLDTLDAALARLRADEKTIGELLEAKLSVWRQNARSLASAL
jgi:polysaccharide pyruvyl transferase WcaK-like protein